MNRPATRKNFMIVNMGPRHPSIHGVLRLILTLDGEDVIDGKPILGYLHRGMEKIIENRTIIQYLPYVTTILGITIRVLVIVWLEREISREIQQRIGPEYAGPLGVIQALAMAQNYFLNKCASNVASFIPFVSQICG